VRFASGTLECASWLGNRSNDLFSFFEIQPEIGVLKDGIAEAEGTHRSCCSKEGAMRNCLNCRQRL